MGKFQIPGLLVTYRPGLEFNPKCSPLQRFFLDLIQAAMLLTSIQDLCVVKSSMRRLQGHTILRR